ncbi:hypothetical protein BG74_04840 [Sodalis-like endosymbiont of Proechinophthirus fluctus]|nr:hypothetical protein BG74_04840 [Sodalis-like endosymbiont of Proechinophthirus fluctus]
MESVGYYNRYTLEVIYDENFVSDDGPLDTRFVFNVDTVLRLSHLDTGNWHKRLVPRSLLPGGIMLTLPIAVVQSARSKSQ